MPFVKLEDGTNLWYYTNMQLQDNKPKWNPSKPTVMIICGKGLTTFAERHMEDPLLCPYFNLIAFNIRSTGKTESVFDPRRDTWMDAADQAQAIMLLGLPPLHVFAAGGELAQLCALYLDVLWDGLVASITFVEAGAKPECALEFKVDEETITEVIRGMATYEDLDSFERVGHELAMFIFGNDISDDVVDTMVEHLEVCYCDHNTPRLYDYMMEILHEPPLNRAILQHVAQPCLFILSSCNTLTVPHLSVHPRELINSQVRVEALQSPPQPHIVEPWARMVFQHFRNFVLQQHRPPRGRYSALAAGEIRKSMSKALGRLARFMGRPELLGRDPMLSASFSQTSLPIIRRRQEFWDELSVLSSGKETGKILDANGRPLRKFSQRNLQDYQMLKSKGKYTHNIPIMSVIFSQTTESEEDEDTA